jgi:metal-responsive CopG/Arc/MetJ family transcriptional regulator
MASRSVQISLPEALLDRLDRRAETEKIGRSAVIQRALVLYMETARRREIDQTYASAYGGQSRETFDEFADLMDGQAWPER